MGKYRKTDVSFFVSNIDLNIPVLLIALHDFEESRFSLSSSSDSFFFGQLETVYQQSAKEKTKYSETTFLNNPVLRQVD